MCIETEYGINFSEIDFDLTRLDSITAIADPINRYPRQLDLKRTGRWDAAWRRWLRVARPCCSTAESQPTKRGSSATASFRIW